jgi:hypothetical protein
MTRFVRKQMQRLQTLIIVIVFALGAGASGAVEYHIGGADSVSDYNWDGSDGVFSFANAAVGADPDLPGFVSSDDIPGSNLTNVDGSGGLAQVAFNIVLGPTQGATGTGDGMSPFVPTSTLGDGNIKKAQFIGGPGVADMIIYKPVSGSPNSIDEILLTFDIDFIDVTNATRQTVDPLPPFSVIDPDGSITLGDATSTALSSFLTVSGGSLAASVGGIGAEARMSIIISTLTPALINGPDFRGYFGANWTSGIGAEPIAGLAYDMVIFEPVVVPEPATGTLLTLSLLVFAAHGRLRRNRCTRS